MSLSNRNPFPIAEAKPNSMFAEAYRTIRTNIELSSPTKPVRTILVTSARAGDGKTTTAANLAVVFAQTNKRVLLIDADLRRPQIHRHFMLANEHGLSQVLKQEQELAELIHVTRLTNLHILTSGPADNGLPVLSTLNFTSIIKKCAAQYDFVVVDSPPILAVSDTLAIIPSVDGVVFVVDAKRTNRFVAKRAISAIQQIHGNILGGIVNRVSKRGRDDYLFYGYGDVQSPANQI